MSLVQSAVVKSTIADNSHFLKESYCNTGLKNSIVIAILAFTILGLDAHWTQPGLTAIGLGLESE
jgi:hypothetical protein